MAAFSQCSICFIAVKLAGYLSPTNDSDWWVMRCFHFRKHYEIRLFITELKYWGKSIKAGLIQLRDWVSRQHSKGGGRF